MKDLTRVYPTYKAQVLDECLDSLKESLTEGDTFAIKAIVERVVDRMEFVLKEPFALREEP